MIGDVFAPAHLLLHMQGDVDGWLAVAQAIDTASKAWVLPFAASADDAVRQRANKQLISNPTWVISLPLNKSQ